MSQSDLWADLEPKPFQAPTSRVLRHGLAVDVGAEVWCSGARYVVAYINADGTVGVERDPGKPSKKAS